MASESNIYSFRVDRDRLPSGIDLIGNGSVGGKAKGLIFVMTTIEKGNEELCLHPELLRFPESTVLATDVFDRFLEMNGISDWFEGFFPSIPKDDQVNKKFLEGDFPPLVRTKLKEFLLKEKRPLIARSSSLLEDDIRHSFAGIYQSIFTSNQGNIDKRLDVLETAIRLVYASTYSSDAVEYMRIKGIPRRREKMAVLIQNVIGTHYDDGLYYPLFAGVAFSKNYYPWSSRIRMDDGVVRLVVGLGTRAVGRFRATVFSPSFPELKPQGMVIEDIIRSSQRKLDALDYEADTLVSVPIDDIKTHNRKLFMIVSKLSNGTYLKEAPRVFGTDDKVLPTFTPILTSDRYVPFVPLIRSLLQNLERVFKSAIDVEFAFDFKNGRGCLYLVQARPLGRRLEHKRIRIPAGIPPNRVILKGRNVLGNGYRDNISHIVYVPYEKYVFYKGSQTAREIGKINRILMDKSYLLIGPGRWATSNPQVGIPVNYSEISNATVIVEVSYEEFAPELSYGTHFFAEMEASNILYIPLFLEKGDFLNEILLRNYRNLWKTENVNLMEIPTGVKVYVDGNSRRGFAHV